MNWKFTKDDSRKVYEQMIRGSTSLVIKGMHI